jgi:ADP-ribose pyrophosphatase YjhB (NUDIX family)
LRFGGSKGRQIEGLQGLCLPGGYIKRIETSDEAAGRIVEEVTSITGLYLQQYKTFDEPDRIKWNEFDIEELSKKPPYKKIKSSWLKDQTISIGYYAITDFYLVEPPPAFMTPSCAWYDIDEIPHYCLMMTIKDALQTLRHSYIIILSPKNYCQKNLH